MLINDDINFIIGIFVVLFLLCFFRLEGNMGIIVGVSIVGVVVLIFVVFFIICLLKRNKF